MLEPNEFNEITQLESSEPSHLKRALSVLISKGVRSQLEKILHDALLLEKIAGRSYYHDNGFDKIVIAKCRDLQLRLHIWWEGSYVEKPSNIHNHRWNFASYLICGEYKHEEYVPHQNGTEIIKAHAYIYKARERKNFYGLIENGDKELELISTSILKKGDFLVSYHNQLHRVTSNRLFTTATFFLNGKVEKATTDVYSFRQLVLSERQKSKAMQPQVLQSRLERLLAGNCFD